MNKKLFGLATSAGFAAYYFNKLSPYWSWYAAAEGKSNPYFRAAVAINPKYQNRATGSQEASLISGHPDNATEKPTFLCVMDPQPGWKRSLVPQGSFANEMAAHVGDIYQKEYLGHTATVAGAEVKSHSSILKEAWRRTQATGGTRCSMIELQPYESTKYGEDALLKTMRLVNAEYVIFRPQRMSAASNEVRVLGPGLFADMKARKRQAETFHITRPNHFEAKRNFRIVSAEHVIQHNDIVILATDGLWHNVKRPEVKQLIKKHIEFENADVGGVTDESQLTLKSPQNLANALSTLAEAKSYMPKDQVPMGQKVQRGKKKQEKVGGHRDDITVIVAQVNAE